MMLATDSPHCPVHDERAEDHDREHAHLRGEGWWRQGAVGRKICAEGGSGGSSIKVATEEHGRWAILGDGRSARAGQAYRWVAGEFVVVGNQEQVRAGPGELWEEVGAVPAKRRREEKVCGC